MNSIKLKIHLCIHYFIHIILERHEYLIPVKYFYHANNSCNKKKQLHKIVFSTNVKKLINDEVFILTTITFQTNFK